MMVNGFEEPKKIKLVGVNNSFYFIIEFSNGFTQTKGTQETIEKGEFLLENSRI